MKVTDTSQIKALAPGKPSEPSKTSASERGAADRVSTEDTARMAAAVAQAARHASGARGAKLAAIEAEVRQGTYKPDPQQIAQQILDDAELAAQLQMMFRK